MAPRANIGRKHKDFFPFWGAKLGTKIGPKSIQDVIIFLMGCWDSFNSIWGPIWLQLGGQNHPKMEPSWLPRAKKTVTSENTKIIKKPYVFQ